LIANQFIDKNEKSKNRGESFVLALFDYNRGVKFMSFLFAENHPKIYV
jgi:hypothetical protein